MTDMQARASKRKHINLEPVEREPSHIELAELLALDEAAYSAFTERKGWPRGWSHID